MNGILTKYNVHYDPRTKIIIILFSTLISTLTTKLIFEVYLIMLILIFGITLNKIRYSIIGCLVFFIMYFSNLYLFQKGYGFKYTMYMAWVSLFYKVYPSCFVARIVFSTTKINEFLSAMNKINVSQKITIPLAIMLRYIPTIREDWIYIKDAMKLRNLTPSIFGLLKSPSTTLECIYVPFIITASKAADELSIAAITRGIENPNKRSCFVEIKYKLNDYIVITVFGILLAKVFYTRWI